LDKLEYIVIIEHWQDALAKVVCTALREGWQLQGGVAMMPALGDEPYWLAQAMVRGEEGGCSTIAQRAQSFDQDLRLRQ
jgi:hypothetical protein